MGNDNEPRCDFHRCQSEEYEEGRCGSFRIVDNKNRYRCDKFASIREKGIRKRSNDCRPEDESQLSEEGEQLPKRPKIQAIRQQAQLGHVNNNLIKVMVRESGAFHKKHVEQWMCKNGLENILFMRGISEKIEIAIKIEQLRLIDMQWEDILKELSDDSPNILHASVAESLAIFRNIMQFQNIDIADFVNMMYKIINRIEIKKNMYVAKGEKNSGKTLVMLSIIQSTKSGVLIQKFDESDNFCLAPMLLARCALWNEPRISDKMIETCKNIAEGVPGLPANQKWEKCSILDRCPTLVASNNDLCHYSLNKKKNEETMSARYIMHIWNTMDDLKHFKKYLNPRIWHYLLEEYVFNPDIIIRDVESFDDNVDFNNLIQF